MTKKTDRRTLYTISVIKSAFLELKETRSFIDITVAELCRAAQISRGTFYLHFHNTYDVLDSILEDIFTGLMDPYSGDSGACNIPMCQLLRDNDKYRCILMDDSLTSVIVSKLTALHEKEFVDRFRDTIPVTDQQLRMLFCFQINGCFAVSKKSKSLTSAEWCSMQGMIDNYINGGIAACSNISE